MTQTSISQNFTLRFTGISSDGNHVQLDSVQVQNISTHWEEIETVVYPDTVLLFQNGGIAQVQNGVCDIKAYPNPFSGHANVSLEIPQSCEATIQVFNLAGQEITKKQVSLMAGNNLFEVRLQQPQVYLLSVTTPQGRSTVKLVNRASAGENVILYSGHNAISEKRLSSNQLLFDQSISVIGFTTHGGIVFASNDVWQTIRESQTITLTFTLSDTPVVPTVIESLISGSWSMATSFSAVGRVLSDGGSPVTARGICYSTNPNPTINDGHTTDGTGLGFFTSIITDLTPATHYYYRFYATNTVGTGYSTQHGFNTDTTTPILTTDTISNISQTSAVCGGNITSDGGLPVTARGVCWSASSNPTISDSHTSDSTGTGSFTSRITGLSPNTHYFVRAYATNANGTSYGNVVYFSTLSLLPAVTTAAVSDITESAAVCGGNVTSSGGSAITARGVCWDTAHNPVVSGSHTTDSTGTGTFTSYITGLLPNTTYYVRAYVTNAAGTAYGSEVSFATLSDVNTGALTGVFSVSDTTHVYFSMGNLQFSTTDSHAVAGGGHAPGKWRFANRQWDRIGASNASISSSYTGWIDLFGWGTSGYNNKSPYMTGSVNADYGNGNNDLSGTNFDWGVYNAIYNGGNTPGQWRTLSADEWNYLINSRVTASGVRYAKATLFAVPGLIIVPDDWDTTIYVLSNVNNPTASFSSNIFSASIPNWPALENAGCVFLPTTGIRSGTTVNNVSAYGEYWTTTCGEVSLNNGFHFFNNNVTTYYVNRRYGLSVRLVKDIALPTVTTGATSNITDTTAVCGGNVAGDGGTPVIARGVCWDTLPYPTTADAHTSDSIGTGVFTSFITGLRAGKNYYVRAYATNAVGTAYGNQDTIVVLGFAPNNAFSVAANKFVYFAPGNLQWSATGGGNSPTTHIAVTGDTMAGTWRFAPNQWDTVGANNNNTSSSYTGWIDLFGWGTSGYNEKYPYYTNNKNKFYGNGTNDISGSCYDWGVFNPIYNPQTSTTDAPCTWRTLTKEEWDYLMLTRPTVSGVRYAKAYVHSIPGFVIVPDNWDTNIYALQSVNYDSASFATNVINVVHWPLLENAGCVFLPADGFRSVYNSVSSVSSVGRNGYYWTTTHDSTTFAYLMSLSGTFVGTVYASRYYGLSVRLVKSANSDSHVFPIAITNKITEITDSTAVCEGIALDNGSTAILARGLCWDTLPNPSIANAHSLDSSGTGVFSGVITGLLLGKTYYVRSYATNSFGTSYGNQQTLYMPMHHPYSVDSNSFVYFAPGNLQWSATGGGNSPTTHAVAGGGTAAGTWRFAPNQWDTVGVANGNTSSSYTGWIDVFGWGTSGYNGKYPYLTTTTNADYGNGNANIDNTYYDWGVYNAIYNPNYYRTDAPGTWRTLTIDEWNYLLNTRSTASGIRYAKARVNRISGLVILPDDWDTATYALTNTNTPNSAFTSNNINLTNWEKMEKNGCTFLPASGYREGTTIWIVNSGTSYWSSTCNNSSEKARKIGIYALHTDNNEANRYLGYSVRLARDI